MGPGPPASIRTSHADRINIPPGYTVRITEVHSATACAASAQSPSTALNGYDDTTPFHHTACAASYTARSATQQATPQATSWHLCVCGVCSVLCYVWIWTPHGLRSHQDGRSHVMQEHDKQPGRRFSSAKLNQKELQLVLLLTKLQLVLLLCMTELSDTLI